MSSPTEVPPEPTRSDLAARVDIHDLVVAFYREVIFDDLLAPVFSEAAEIDWALHIPKLIDYWCRVLLGEVGYAGAILASHQHVHEVEPFRAEHFDRWYELWTAAIDRGWEGPLAERAKTHAARIGGVIAGHLDGCTWDGPDVPSAMSTS